ncbi:MAG: hypothetical protein WC360_08845, partial [Opitutales bacterium]
ESNPKGYYEDERVKKLPFGKDHSWLEECRGKVIKIVAPLLGDIPANIPVKVIFMERDMGEVLKSQASMLKRGGRRASGSEDASIAAAYAAQIRNVERMLWKRPATSVLPVSHADALKDPAGTARAVAEFLGGGLDEQTMAAVIDPSLYRARA